LARDLERELATATRERDEARALNVEWAKKAETWLATPEAAQRLQSYRDLGQQVAEAQNERDEARAIANDRDAMVDHRDRALTAMYQRVDVITQERDKAIADLETESLRLAACGVVAMANTPESAARARDILPKHFSESLHFVMGAVDREMELRAEVERLRGALRSILGWRELRSGANEFPVDRIESIAKAALAAAEAKP
jgi:hypothetical protein